MAKVRTCADRIFEESTAFSLSFACSPGAVTDADGLLQADDSRGQDLLDSLTVLPVVAKQLVPDLYPRLTSLLPALAVASRSTFAVVRYSVAQAFAAICDVVPTEALRQIVETVIPVLGDPLHVDHRRGAMETIARAFILELDRALRTRI